ncbi:MAG: tRNA pseudouridine(38-40) synthase TruA [Planctomycetes bacterium]|nr:tRNA pseudouridine(38-40) synthase TruA [Planctomycetota bacterium]
MRRNIKLIIAYDGTDFHGWQSQPGLRTVQGEIETAVRRVCGHPLNVNGASRTDAGVHARGQVATFIDECGIPAANLARAIGHRLPSDISIVHASAAPFDLHASRSARSKLYRYSLFTSDHRPVETLRQRFAHHLWLRLDPDRLRAAAAKLVGTHDFAGMASKGSPRATTVRTIRRISVRRVVDELLIDVEGDGFLYNQVRNMVGTLIEIGRGHWPCERIDEILKARDRSLAGPTAPAHGLCLQWVRY